MMRKHVLTGFLVVVVVLVAGCTAPEIPRPDGGGEDTDESEEKTVDAGLAIDGPRCTVDGTSCDAADITEYSVPKVTLSVTNDGPAPVTFHLNKRGAGGNQVMVAKCDAYRIKEFRATAQRASDTEDVATSRMVKLESGDSLQMEWFFELNDDVNRSQSFSCLLHYQSVFTQKITALHQLQVRGGEDIPRATGLEHTASSSNPVELVVEAPSSVVQEVIGGEVNGVQAKSYVRNRGTGTITQLQDKRSGEHIHLAARGIKRQECSNRNIAGASGPAGTARICNLVAERIESSQIYDIVARTTYTYQQDLSPVELALKPLEVEQ